MDRDLAGNQLSGHIPSSIGNLTKAYLIDLNTNQLTGSIPQSFKQLTGLQRLDLGQNKLSGDLLDFTGLKSLNY
ncbi:hypothetical protein HDU76_001993, partial [Blyttiomyces sp. JEL0837]